MNEYADWKPSIGQASITELSAVLGRQRVVGGGRLLLRVIAWFQQWNEPRLKAGRIWRIEPLPPAIKGRR